MDSNQIRQLFASFFAERGHRHVPSSSLIPPPDERTLLFTNAGMNQMKPYFMGLAEAPARRMTSIQKCFRTSDIEEVGDNSHCTFFEMLGNFSVGDYFKAEVIPWAWELLTAPEPKGMGLDKDRIWTTVYLDDDEAYDLWRGCGIPAERIVRFDESENYWFMIKGGAGPCGPNSEIYYDFGPEHGCGKTDCAPPLHTPPDCGRFLEIWNLVFMSLYQEEDGKTRRPLPMRNVDTGAGLERWLPVYMWQNQVDWQGNQKRWQSPPTIYDTDLFRPILAKVEELAGITYGSANDEQQRAIRVVAEHTRAATFLIADGVTPANDGRGYVLRRLIRRGTSSGQRLKQGQQFLAASAEAVIERMAQMHDSLREQRDFILRTLRSEESRFALAVSRGSHLLYEQQIPLRRKMEGLIAASEIRVQDLLRQIHHVPTDFASASGLMKSRGELSRELAALKRTLEFETSVIEDHDDSLESDAPLEWSVAEVFDQYFPDHDFKMEGLDTVSAASLRYFEAKEGKLFDRSGVYPGSHLMLYEFTKPPANPPIQRGYNRALAEADQFLRNLFDFLKESVLRMTGKDLFILQDRHGLPLDVAMDIAREEGLTVDADALEQFEALMEEQRTRSRASQRFDADAERIQTYAELGLHPTEFVGYETTRAFGHVAAILLDGTTVVRELTPELAASHRVEVALTQTPFYAEGGGQVGDRGEIVWPGGRFVVEDTQHVGDGGVVAHVGRLESGTLSAGDPIEGRVDESLRADTMRNHTATHILHAALRNILGTHVRQAGSLVTPDRLRFDFTHLEAMTPEQVRAVEALANRVVRDNLTVHVEHKSYEEALADGALAFFGDKYADVVRVVGVWDVELHDCFSHELCGGTHVHASGEVGSIIITSETSIGAGMRRIEAVTGRAAAERLRAGEDTIAHLSAALMAPAGEVEARVAALREENDRLRRQLQALERRAAREASQSIAATQIGDTSVVVERVEAASADALREVGDGLKSTHKSAVILLGAVIDGKPAFVAMSTPDVAKRCPAGDVVRAAAQAAGGNGGGRPESAQGGGTDPAKLDAALAAARKLIEEKLTAQ